MTKEVIKALAIVGVGVRPINRGKGSIKDEPKYELYKLAKNEY